MAILKGSDQRRAEITAPLIYRRQVRRLLMANPKIKFTEDKGLLNSFFVIDAPQEDMHILGQILKEAGADIS